MKYKTLLLGTAAIFAVATGARAADLAVAESVEYVKVCDAYGTGYFYIPGSDTCLKISGDVGVWAEYDSAKINEGTVSNSAGEDDLNYFFHVETNIAITAKSMTDWGMLTSFVNLRNSRGGGTNTDARVETGYLSLGGFTAGWLASQFDGEVPAGLIGGSNFDHDQHQIQFAWSTKAGPWGLTFSVEDPNDDVGAGTTFEELAPIPGYAPGSFTGSWPNLVQAITYSGGPFSAKLAVGEAATTVGTGVGAKLTGTWSANGNSLGFQVAASNAAGSAYGANIAPGAYGSGTYWMAGIGGGLAITQALTLYLLAGYQAAPGHSAYELQGELDWKIAKGMVVGAYAAYNSHGTSGLQSDDNPGITSVQVRFDRTFD